MITFRADDKKEIGKNLRALITTLFSDQLPLEIWRMAETEQRMPEFQRAHLTRFDAILLRLRNALIRLDGPKGASDYAEIARDQHALWDADIAKRVKEIDGLAGFIAAEALHTLRIFIQRGGIANTYGTPPTYTIDLEFTTYSREQFNLLWRVAHIENERPYLLPPEHFTAWLGNPQRDTRMGDVIPYLEARTGLRWEYSVGNGLFVTLDDQRQIVTLNAQEQTFVNTDVPNRRPASALISWMACVAEHEYSRWRTIHEDRVIVSAEHFCDALHDASVVGASLARTYIGRCYMCGHYVMQIPAQHVAACDECAIIIERQTVKTSPR